MGIDEIVMELERWRGYSAYEIAARQGFEGSEREWLESLKGRDGVTDKSVANNLTTNADGWVLDARQGKALKDLLDGLAAEVGKKLNAGGVANNLTTQAEGYVLDARQGRVLNQFIAGKASKTAAAASLPASGWAGAGPFTQTVNAAGVTASNVVVASPAPASFAAWSECGVRASAQAAGRLTFTAELKPPAALTANVLCVN